MMRGRYRSFDRNKHFVLGLATDEAIGYVRDETVGAALRPAMPTIADAYKAARGAQRMWIGSKMIGGRGEAQRPLTQVGQEFFHTVTDRVRAMAALSTYFNTFVNDLATWQIANLDKPEAQTIAQWIEADVTPTLEEWRMFTTQQKTSWWNKAATSWEAYEEWWNRIRRLRELARAHGAVLQSSEPTPLPKTIWQRAEDGKGNEATALLGVLKVGIFAALTITGAVSLFSVLGGSRRTVHHHHVDPHYDSHHMEKR